MKASEAVKALDYYTPEEAIHHEYGDSKNFMTPYNRYCGRLCGWMFP